MGKISFKEYKGINDFVKVDTQGWVLFSDFMKSVIDYVGCRIDNDNNLSIGGSKNKIGIIKDEMAGSGERLIKGIYRVNFGHFIVENHNKGVLLRPISLDIYSHQYTCDSVQELSNFSIIGVDILDAFLIMSIPFTPDIDNIKRKLKHQ